MIKKTIIYFSLIICFFSALAENHLHFIRISSNDGLSQNTVNVIFKDDNGFMWFGTDDGLNRYDGKNFKIFKIDNSGTNSIGANSITSIVEDTKGLLWIGTKQNGISIYFPKADSFAILHHSENDSNSLSNNNVTNLFFDKPNRIFISYINGKIDIFNLATNKITHLKFTKSSFKKFRKSENVTFIKDYYGRVWIGSKNRGLFLLGKDNSLKHISLKAYCINSRLHKKLEVGITGMITLDKTHFILSTLTKGLLVFNNLDNSYRQIFLSSNKLPNNNLNFTTCISRINDTTFWIGTVDAGIVEYNTITGQKIYFNTETFNNNLIYNNIISIFKDNIGIVWVSLNGFGVWRYSLNTSFFKTIKGKNKGQPFLHFRSVRSINKKGNNVWIGGYIGLDVVNIATHKTTIIKQNGIIPYDMVELSGDTGYLWYVPEEKNYLQRLNMLSGNFSKIYPFVHSNINYDLPFYKILPVDDTMFWLGGTNGNLFLYNYKKRKIINHFFSDRNKKFVKGIVQSLLLRKNGQLWIGSATDGIIVINSKTYKTIYRFKNEPDKSTTIHANTIKTMIEDKNLTVWIGTANGLYHFNDSTSKFFGYYVENGLPNNTVYGILEDKKGFLWLSTNKGISRYNPKTGHFINFDKTENLQGNEFNTNAYCKDNKDDFFCFGGINGITYFYPDNYIEDTINVSVKITDIFINDKRIKLYPAEPFTNEVNVPVRTHGVKLYFAGLDYINPNRNNYRYKINNGSWIFLGNNNRINLGFFGYGKNKVVINASNADGIWSNKTTNITLNYLRPFYLTTWAFIFAGIFIILTTIFIIYSRTLLLKRRERILKMKINSATKELLATQYKLNKEIAYKEQVEKELRKSNITKDTMFSIIAHDLISPFNALLGFTDLLKENYDNFTSNEIKTYIDIIHNASERLYNFIQNLLYWSRTQQKRIKPDPVLINLYKITNEVCELLNRQAADKKILLINTINKNITVVFDKNMLHTILRNLISNAIKFNYSGKKITMGAKIQNQSVLAWVSDEGVGMDENLLKNIFKPDKKNKSKGTNNEEGTGLGLLIVKEFIDLSGETIRIESQPDKGSTFYITLPLVKTDKK